MVVYRIALFSQRVPHQVYVSNLETERGEHGTESSLNPFSQVYVSNDMALETEAHLKVSLNPFSQVYVSNAQAILNYEEMGFDVLIP